eukprot:750632-Hanusia_phi.AAC.4
MIVRQERKNVKLDLGRRRGSQINYIPTLQPSLDELIETKFSPREQVRALFAFSPDGTYQEMIHRLLAELSLEEQKKVEEQRDGMENKTIEGMVVKNDVEPEQLARLGRVEQ